MRTLVMKAEQCRGLPDLECLEQVYERVRVGDLVKFRGKAYRRARTKNNKYYKYPYHFVCASKNIYEGNCIVVDGEGENVNILCDFVVKVMER